MPRYTLKPRSSSARWAEDVPYLPDLEVISDGPVDTGLVTPEGMKIWREPEPIGFPLIGDEQDGGHE